MKPVGKLRTRHDLRRRRHLRLRRKVSGTAERPRLAVFRSAKHIYAQLVDDVKGHTLASASDLSGDLSVEGAGKKAAGLAVGKLIGKLAAEMGVKSVVFDRGGYPYHGRVRAVADGARDAGLEF